ncbi:MAG: response regulator [Myxococcota bacterium]
MLTYAGRAPVELCPLDLSQLVRDAQHLLSASVAGKSRLEFDLASDLPAVEGDVTRIQQVLVNLVSNASESLGDAGGTVCVRTGQREADAPYLSDAFGASDAAPGPYVTVEVSDTGRGMDLDVRERVFEPFFTTKSSGRGLGLAAVLGIVSSHRGVIRIQSKLGEGTAFQVLFPRVVHPAVPAPQVSEPVAKSGRGEILVVDDDDAVLELAREFLERAGFDVLTASSGEAGVALLSAHKDEIAAVVLDLVMPGMGGGEAMVEMLRIRPELPVVVTSGYDKEKVAERLSTRDIADFLYKPYEPEDLVESVRKAVIGSP